MGKNHNKDAMYIKASEWAAEWGGKKAAGTRHAFKKLPFNCCALSLRPFEDPVCTPEGHCFDISNIIPYLKKKKKNPVTGLPLSAKDLSPLHFHKNVDGDFICPILQKVFTDNSVIVAVKVSGNVYSKEAVTKLNFGTKNLVDLISGEPFTRADVITLQDPVNASLLPRLSVPHLCPPRRQHPLWWCGAWDPFGGVPSLEFVAGCGRVRRG
jgi:peptidyl-prolyl cis-trans isomerase-like protein 2